MKPATPNGRKGMFMTSMKPLTMVAIVVVLLGFILFLALPLIVGSGFGVGYPVSKADHISAWTWKGVYADGADKEAMVTKEIARLKGLVGKGSISDYDLYVGISSEYELLGDGKNTYQYLSRAITLDPKRGLAYMNMGHLMEELGAITTAHEAYDQAVKAEPTNAVYQAAQQNFLVHHSQKP